MLEKHIIPYDNYFHIDSLNCGCNPSIINSEGEVIYMHNIKNEILNNNEQNKNYR